MTMNTGIGNHERTSEDLSDRLDSGTRPDLGDWSFEGIGGGIVFGDSDPGVYFDVEDGGDLDLGLRQGDFSIAHHASQALGQAAQRHIPYVKAGRRPKAVSEKVNEDDFEEGAERNAFSMVMHFAHRLLHKRSTPDHQREGLKYFFSEETKDLQSISFQLCSNVLMIRPDIIRLRVQYEWWLRATVFTGPFDFDSVPMPKILEGEILYHGGNLGHALAREVWVQPGISTEELFAYVGQAQNTSTAKMVQAVDSLCEHYILSKSSGWYLTGRNPMLMNMSGSAYQPTTRVSGGSVHWTRLFAQTI